ncbi:MAG: NIPSNAP family protein [Planctomycetaceae bacterium]|jgi:hypothetical protein|nr:NIPSNAP family protein [Planctomycetaceae bacterium]
MKTFFGWLLVCFLGGLMIGDQATAQDPLYELRVYTPEEGRQADLLKLMENTGIKFLSKHKIELVGAWVANDASDPRVVTLVRHADRKTCDAAWTAFGADPDWQAAYEASAVNGKKPTKSVTRIFLNTNDYSPKLAIENVGNRVFELRTYITTPNNLGALNNRFRNHTMTLFKKHGMNNVIYWSIASGESIKAKELLDAVSPQGQAKAEISDDLPAAGNSLVYFLTHASPEAQKASFGTFRDDPTWNQVRTDSEKAAGGSLTAGGGVKSWFLKPTSFSPLK